MSMPEQNPFAAPAADATQGAERWHLERGPMPTGIVILLVLLGLGLLVQVVGLIQGNLSSIIPLAIGGLILAGIACGHKLAWQWGRISGLLGGLIYLLAVFGVILAVAAVFATPEVFQSDPQMQNVPHGQLQFLIVISAVVVVITLITCWYMYFILGTESARRYFKTMCPGCGSKKIKATDFFFRQARCKQCHTTWG